MKRHLQPLEVKSHDMQMKEGIVQVQKTPMGNTYMMILMKILTFATRFKMQVYTLDGHVEY